MIDKYSNHFREMHQRIYVDGESPLEVVNEYRLFFEKEGIHSNLGIVSYLEEYASKKN
ncbi:hypothetical protein M0R19_02325 [Candidatus Pacearchaeota archaeon]|nr:hypothetical protein [Candidatus Pacearchaeota archaeon]